jgi:hypothetical protein
MMQAISGSFRVRGRVRGQGASSKTVGLSRLERDQPLQALVGDHPWCGRVITELMGLQEARMDVALHLAFSHAETPRGLAGANQNKLLQLIMSQVRHYTTRMFEMQHGRR